MRRILTGAALKETLIDSEFQRRTDAPPFLIALSD